MRKQSFRWRALCAPILVWAAWVHAAPHDEVKPIPDGVYSARLDADRQLFVPARNAMGTLFVVPSRNDFDSVRIRAVLLRRGVPVGLIDGGIVYWRNGQCVIAFDGVAVQGGRIIPGRGYFPVAALDILPKPGDAIHPGMTVFVPGTSKREWPLVIDHTVSPPTDEADDDGD
ncbi:hypothetical protein FAZ69_08520 [Trinickia terrae]|uniref:Uncharacterized protein n=1 Tax=Trinickia terrae TaxID=2571161 RepID=A0A4U1I9I9_9BURK|nr:hypothetical protein [Trinickia terrae]TKC90181.1 hypothetical protein FAZ69_08520 [Trinickia terrae]